VITHSTRDRRLRGPARAEPGSSPKSPRHRRVRDDPEDPGPGWPDRPQHEQADRDSPRPRLNDARSGSPPRPRSTQTDCCRPLPLHVHVVGPVDHDLKVRCANDSSQHLVAESIWRCVRTRGRPKGSAHARARGLWAREGVRLPCGQIGVNVTVISAAVGWLEALRTWSVHFPPR
jgi:hypothetical protein